MLGPDALGRPRGIGRRGKWEGGSGWGIHVTPWLIHVNVWQKPLQYCKVISLQLIKKFKKNCLKIFTLKWFLKSWNNFHKGLEVGLGWVDESANTCTLANVKILHFSYLYVCSQSLVPHSPTEWVNIWVHRERQSLTVWMGPSRKHTLQHFWLSENKTTPNRCLHQLC